jgi:rhodanese-related sulfurtransferase
MSTAAPSTTATEATVAGAIATGSSAIASTAVGSPPVGSSILSRVLEAPPLAPAEAAAYFAEALRRYTDAADVHADLADGVTDIIIVDARSPESYAAKHIPGAVNVPHRMMGPDTLAQLPQDKVIVTYCDGIGCNASTKAAMKLARLGYRVKELIGGIAFWEYDGFPVHGTAVASPRNTDVTCGC